MKIVGHHADDGVGVSIQSDGLPKFAGISVEAVVPEAVAQNGDLAAAGLIFLRAERASHDRLGAQRLKEIGTHTSAQNSFRSIFSGEIEVCGAPCG